jgi:hypothetical protein
MKLKKVGFSLALCPLVFFCSCAVVGHKFEAPSAEQLEFGKLTPAAAITAYGKPEVKTDTVNSDGSFEVYKYTYAENGVGSVNARQLLLEFKEGKLNAYYFWSTFDKDKTKVDMAGVEKLKAGVGKLTKDEVMALAGKPNAKGLCPTVLTDLKDKCPKNTEVWGWLRTDNINVWIPRKITTSELYVSFDADGKLSGVSAANADPSH